jgi:hypothetical protein
MSGRFFTSIGTHAVHNDARDIGDLVDDPGKQLPAHVGWRLELLERARAGLAEQVAAIGNLEIEANRRLFGDARAIGSDLLEVSTWVFHGNRSGHVESPVSAVSWRLVTGCWRSSTNSGSKVRT